jgi:hypothetical protein
MEQGQTIGNTTDYFVNPCPYTISYYTKQINDSLKQAFRENPRWKNPGSRKEAAVIIDEIREWYNPFLYTDLVSSTFESLWRQAMSELWELLNSKAPKVKARRRKSNNRIGELYDHVRLEKVIDKLREQGMSLRTIGNLSGVHFTTISHMKKGTGPYCRNRVSPAMDVLLKFFESLGVDIKGVIVSDRSDFSPGENKINEKLLQGVLGDSNGSPRPGAFLEKSPPCRRRQKGGKDE